MKLRIQFGLLEPPRELHWWQPIGTFPALVLHKGKKWEFEMYNSDPAGKVDWICYFSEVMSYNPNWHSNTYQDIDYLFDTGYGGKCECGAIYTSFPWDHMKYCPQWSKW